MNTCTKTLAAAFLIALASCTTVGGQQSETPKHAPTLTVDDVQRARGGTSLSMPLTNEWTRYPFIDIGISLELPSEPLMSSDLQQGSAIKTYHSFGQGFRVFVVQAQTPNSRAAWDFVGGILEGFTRATTDAKIRLNRSSRSKRVPVTVTCKIKGLDSEFKGDIFFIDRRNEVVLVLSEYAQEDARARADGARAVASVQLQQ